MTFTHRSPSRRNPARVQAIQAGSNPPRLQPTYTPGQIYAAQCTGASHLMRHSHPVPNSGGDVTRPVAIRSRGLGRSAELEVALVVPAVVPAPPPRRAARVSRAAARRQCQHRVSRAAYHGPRITGGESRRLGVALGRGSACAAAGQRGSVLRSGGAGANAARAGWPDRKRA